jgi:gliding motility-associated-like protein
VDFRVYNQWGNLVFSSTNPNEGWDGTYKGVKQPGGVYVYTAVGTTLKGRFVRLSGNVTLIR